jgi:ribosomal protein S18 acetylase RimI-like enzyme
MPFGKEKPMKIRNSTPHDAGSLARLLIDAWRTAYRGLVPDGHLARLDHARTTQRFRLGISERPNETYVAEESGEIVGFLTLGACRDDDVDRATTGEIWGIYLAPRHWRKGIGRALCHYGERLLCSRGYLTATLWVFGDNDPARRFYEAMGFAPDGASKTLHVGADLEAVRYRKELAGA